MRPLRNWRMALERCTDRRQNRHFYSMWRSAKNSAKKEEIQTMHLLRDCGGSHIDLEQLDTLLFRAPQTNLWVPLGGRGVFGGQLLGQALHAATRTVTGTIPSNNDEESRQWKVHSIHAHFLQAGNPNYDVIYRVRKTSDRKSFMTRTVEAIQRGECLGTMQASFAKKQPTKESSVFDFLASSHPTPSMDHEYPTFPEDIPPPEDCLSILDIVDDLLNRVPSQSLRDQVKRTLTIPVEMRLVGERLNLLDPNPPKREPRRRVWMRVNKIDTPGLNECCAAYFSDHFLLVTALMPHGIYFPSPKLGVVASLDHAMWFHSPFKADEWMLYDTYSPRLCDSRGLAIGHMFSAESKKLCVTSVQEGLLRLAKPSPTRLALSVWMRANHNFDLLKASIFGKKNEVNEHTPSTILPGMNPPSSDLVLVQETDYELTKKCVASSSASAVVAKDSTSHDASRSASDR